MSSEKVIAGDCSDIGIGGSSFGGITMRTTMTIDIVPMAESPSFAFAMGDKLGTPQFNERCKALASCFQW